MEPTLAGGGGSVALTVRDQGPGVPEGLADGPLPTHYEPLESPVQNDLYGRATNPGARRYDRADNPLAPSGDPRFPHVLTTYRLTEHHTAGGMSRSEVPGGNRAWA